MVGRCVWRGGVFSTSLGSGPFLVGGGFDVWEALAILHEVYLDRTYINNDVFERAESSSLVLAQVHFRPYLSQRSKFTMTLFLTYHFVFEVLANTEGVGATYTFSRVREDCSGCKLKVAKFQAFCVEINHF